MSQLPTLRPARAFAIAVLAGISLLGGGCSKHSELEVPLLVMAGPENFSSFELRTDDGEILWRLEASMPSKVPHLVYAVIPHGFRQTIPANGLPRSLRVGEDILLESRMPSMVFLHRAFARSDSTITVLDSEMRRIDTGRATGDG